MPEEMHTQEDNEEELEEYVTFTITTREGKEVELAVIDEFEFEHKSYVAAARIEEDAICEDGLFIYRAKESEDGFVVEKIKSQVEYQRIAKAYMELETSEE